MAKTKKTTKSKKKTVATANIVATGTQTINYMGKLNVKLTHGNKVIHTKQYTNSGMPNLFKFLCSALAGTYVDKHRPCQIKLFSFLDYLKTKPNEFKWDNAENKNNLLEMSSWITYDSSPVMQQDGDTYIVTYHFRIPFTRIANSSTSDGALIHAVGLYPANAIDKIKDISAYYLFVDEDNKKEWDALDLKNNSENYSIIIDWTLTVLNKSVDTSTSNN